MKKIIQALIILFSITSMFTLTSLYKENEIGKIIQTFGMRRFENTSLEYSGDFETADFKGFINVLMDTAKEYGATLIVEDFDRENFKYAYYIYSDTPIDQLFNIELSSYTFDDESDLLISTRESMDVDYRLKMLNKHYVVDFLSMSSISEESLVLLFDIYHEDAQVLQEIKGIITELLPDGAAVFYDFVAEPYDIDSRMFTNMLFIDIIIFSLLIISMLFFVSSRLKDISVYKLNGYSNIQILRKMLLKELVTAIIVGMVLSALYFYVTVGFINSDSMPILKDFVTYTVIFLIVLTVIIILINVLIYLMRLSSLLKGNNYNSHLASVIYIIKIVSVIFLLPLLLQKTPEMVDLVSRMNVKKFNSDILSRTLESKSFVYSIRDKEYHFGEWSHKTENQEYLNQQAMLKELQKLGAYYMGESFYIGAVEDISFLDVDVNYLPYLPIDQEAIYDELKKHDIVFLIDNELRNGEFNFDYLVKDNTYSQIYVDLPEIVLNRQDNGFKMIAVNLLDSNRLSKTFFNNVYYTDIELEALEAVAERFGYKDMIDFSDIDLHISAYQSEINDLLFVIVLVYIVLVVIAFSFFFTYQRSNQQKINIKRLHGYSFLRIYAGFIIETIAAYLIPLFLLRNNLNEGALVIVLVEILIIMGVYAYYKTSKLPQEIKKGGSNETYN